MTEGKPVFSTGIPQGFNEARTMRQVALLLGVPDRDILCNGPWLCRWRQTFAVFREYAALGWYWMSGRLG